MVNTRKSSDHKPVSPFISGRTRSSQRNTPNLDEHNSRVRKRETPAAYSLRQPVSELFTLASWRWMDGWIDKCLDEWMSTSFVPKLRLEWHLAMQKLQFNDTTALIRGLSLSLMCFVTYTSWTLVKPAGWFNALSAHKLSLLYWCPIREWIVLLNRFFWINRVNRFAVFAWYFTLIALAVKLTTIYNLIFDRIYIYIQAGREMSVYTYPCVKNKNWSRSTEMKLKIRI